MTSTKREKVYIASAYRGDTESNIAKARQYCRLAYEQGYEPIAPHLFYPQFLDDNIGAERQAGMQFALDALTQAKELWVFGKVTKGIEREIEHATTLGIPIRYIEK